MSDKEKKDAGENTDPVPRNPKGRDFPKGNT
jgi:hypothetical protein